MVILIPFFYGFYFSMTNWNGVSESIKFVGLVHFGRVLTQPGFIYSFLISMAVLLDGSVPLCRECVRKEIVLGNLFEGGEPTAESIEGRLASVWIEGERYHQLHVSGAYPAPCAECDEYYTYNA